MHSSLKFAAAAFAVLMTGACALPLPVTVASMVADGVSYMTTEKSLTDHGLSALSQQDCAMHRVLAGGQICLDDETPTNAYALVSQESATAVPRYQKENPVPGPNRILTAENTVSVDEYGSIGTPMPGVYMVIGSSHDFQAARRFSVAHSDMSPRTIALPVGGRRVIYRVLVGPMTKPQYDAARAEVASRGLPNTWAIRIEAEDWRNAREIERSRAQQQNKS